MHRAKHKIPFTLKLKRLKNSDLFLRFNDIFSYFKKPRVLEKTPYKILLIRNDRIGDAVVTLPVARNIKLNYPDLKIDIIVSGRNRFVFDESGYFDEIIHFEWMSKEPHGIYDLYLLGGIFQFIFYALIPFLFNKDYRNKVNLLKDKKYDAVFDLVGLKRNIVLSRYISDYCAGPRKAFFYWLYDYYMDSNWVTTSDNNFMTAKIEKLLTGSLCLNIEKRNNLLPYIHTAAGHKGNTAYDLVFHLGSSELRKLSYDNEKLLIESYTGMSILVTDSGLNSNYRKLKDSIRHNGNVQFKLYASLKDMAPDCINAGTIVCYDGGQAHYLSQYARTVTIFGPGSVALWKPYEFSDYSLLEQDKNGTTALISGGVYRHIALYYPVWCRPCFDTGCRDRPCVENIRVEFIQKIINTYCLNRD